MISLSRPRHLVLPSPARLAAPLTALLKHCWLGLCRSAERPTRRVPYY